MTQVTSSRRPYFIRAMVEWMSDNGLTPFLIVAVEHEGVQVPEGYEEDGKIILNISAGATEGLLLGNQLIEFSARFGGVVRTIRLPPAAVLGIYARETGEGMIFAAAEDGPTGDDPDGPDVPPGGDGGSGNDGGDDRPKLRIVR